MHEARTFNCTINSILPAAGVTQAVADAGVQEQRPGQRDPSLTPKIWCHMVLHKDRVEIMNPGQSRDSDLEVSDAIGPYHADLGSQARNTR
jgi:hypothetical protein